MDTNLHKYAFERVLLTMTRAIIVMKMIATSRYANTACLFFYLKKNNRKATVKL